MRIPRSTSCFIRCLHFGSWRIENGMADLNANSMAPRTGQKHDQSPRRRWLMAILSFLLAGWVMGGSPARAAESAAGKEFQIKAVFLYNFAQFVEWPANAFPSPISPLVIGVL